MGDVSPPKSLVVNGCQFVVVVVVVVSSSESLADFCALPDFCTPPDTCAAAAARTASSWRHTNGCGGSVFVFCRKRRASCVDASSPASRRVRLGGPLVAAAAAAAAAEDEDKAAEEGMLRRRGTLAPPVDDGVVCSMGVDDVADNATVCC